ncbi:unnamed protein product [Musa hybrid cultivar]
MGCFLACFGGSKNRKRRRSPRKSLPLERAQERCRPPRPNVSTKQITPKSLTPDLSPLNPAVEDNTLPELKENLAQGSLSRTRKKVTFNLNVQTYEEVSGDEDSKCLLEDDEGPEAVDEDGKPHEGQDEFSPKLGAFPLNHRYQNCEISDDDGSDCGGDEEEDYSDSDFDEEEDDEVGTEEKEEESYDSFFSLAIDEEPQRLQEVRSPEPKCPSSPGRQPILLAGGGNKRDRSQYVHPVLNPVQNLTQWKEVKVHSARAKNAKVENADTEKENQMMFCSEAMNNKAKKPQGSVELDRTPNCSTKQEISVDASLSNWLLSSENSTVEGPEASNSPRSNSAFSREDRPILGALTVEDLKQASVTSSPRRSPSRSTDEKPILGTVGRYWNSKNQGDDSASSHQPSSGHNGSPNTTIKYREDKPVNWNSTPFEVMLERALETGTA